MFICGVSMAVMLAHLANITYKYKIHEGFWTVNYVKATLVENQNQTVELEISIIGSIIILK